MARKTGRPTDCTPETTRRIVDAVRLGLSYDDAAAAGGVGYTTMRDWINRAEAEQQRLADNPKARPRTSEQPFLDFSEALRKAEAEGQLRNAALVQKAADEQNWRAAAWILERRHSKTWGSNAELWQAYHQLRQELGIDSSNQTTPSGDATGGNDAA